MVILQFQSRPCLPNPTDLDIVVFVSGTHLIEVLNVQDRGAPAAERRTPFFFS